MLALAMFLWMFVVVADAHDNGPIAIDGVFAGEVSAVEPVQRWTFDVDTAGTRVLIDDLRDANDWGVSFHLFGPYGRELMATDVGVLTELGPHILVAGPHTLEVRSRDGSIAPFEGRILHAEEYVHEASFGVPIAIEPMTLGERHRIEFEVTTPGRYVVDLQQDLFGTGTLELESPAGRVLGGTFLDDRGPMELGPGRYVVRVDQGPGTSISGAVTVFGPGGMASAVLPLGTSTTGSLDTPGQVDRWTIPVSEGDRLYIEGNSGNFAALSISHSGGETLFNGNLQFFGDTFGPLPEGVCTVEVGTGVAAPGAYELFAALPPAISGTLTPDIAHSLPFTEPGQLATFDVDIAHDGWFRPANLGGGTVRWSLGTSDGMSLVPTESTDSASEVWLTPGSYRAVFSMDGAAPTPVDIGLFEVTEVLVPVTVGQTVSVDAAHGGEQLVLPFSVGDGQRLRFVFSAWENYRPALETTDGRVLFEGNDLTFDTPSFSLSAGDYRFRLAPGIGDPAAVSVTVVDEGFDAALDPGEPLALGVSSTIDVPGASVVNSTLSLAVPTSVVFEVDNASFFVNWTLTDEFGVAWVASEPTTDDGILGPVDLPAGAFVLSLENIVGSPSTLEVLPLEVDPPTAAPLVFDSEVTGVLSGTRRYTFTVADPSLFTFDLLDVHGPFSWAVERPDGSIVDAYEVATWWSDFNELTLLPGDYVLRTVGVGSDYSFNAHMNTTLESSIAFGDEASGTLSFIGDSVRYALSVPSTSEGLIGLTGDSVRAILYDPVDGARVELSTAFGADSSALRFAPGDWVLEVKATANDSTFRVAWLPAEVGGSAVVGEPLTSNFSRGFGFARRTFTVTEPTRVLATATSDERTEWRLVDASGAVLFDRSLDGPEDFGVFALDAGSYVSEVRFDTHSSISNAVTVSLRPGEDRSASFDGRRWTALGEVGPADRVELIDVASEGEWVDWSFGVLSDSVSYALLDVYGQPIRHGVALHGTTPYSGELAGGTYRLVVDGGTIGSDRVDVRVGRDEIGDTRAFYSRNVFANDLDPHRASLMEVGYSFGPAGLEFGVRRPVRRLDDERYDSVILSPDGDLVLDISVGLDIVKYDPHGDLEQRVEIPSIPGPWGSPYGGSYRSGLLPDGRTVWSVTGLTPLPFDFYSDNKAGQLWFTPLFPLSEPVQLELHGHNTLVTNLAFRGEDVFYSALREEIGDAFGTVGTVDLETGETRSIRTGLPNNGGVLLYDDLSDKLILLDEQVIVIDPDDGSLDAQIEYPSALGDRPYEFDQGERIGGGRYLYADLHGRILSIDFADSGVFSRTDQMQSVFLDHGVDDIAPVTRESTGCLGSPTVSDLTPGWEVVAGVGVPLVVSGRIGVVAPTRAVTAVQIGPHPAILDAGGQFFGSVPVVEGVNEFPVVLSERCGDRTVGTLVVRGVPDPTLVDGFEDVSDRLAVTFSDSSWALDTRRLGVDVVATNQSGVALSGPLRLVLDDDVVNSISFAEPDAGTADGRPTKQVLGAETVDPGASVPSFRLHLFNPLHEPLANSLRWESAGNLAPRFTSVPEPFAVVGNEWSYRPTLFDAEGESVSVRVAAAPEDLSFDGSVLRWDAVTADLGLHAIEIEAEDPFGNRAVQRFTLQVRSESSNRPPVFATVPTLTGDSGASYVYAASVVDPDGDALAYTLVAGPASMTVDMTGRVTWTPPGDGTYDVELAVDDGRGGLASQQWTIHVGTGPTNPNAPRITSSPNPIAGAEDLYAYQAVAVDADDDLLTWLELTVPPGAALDALTGRLSWVPTRDQVGVHVFEIAVSDGENAALQRFEVTVNPEPADAPPVFSTSPLRSAVVDHTWVYAASAVDPEGGPVSYALLSAPAGASIDVEGRVSWTPTALPPGNTALFGLEATDSGGQRTQQAFIVTVTDSSAPPTLDVGSPGPAVIGDVWTHTVSGDDPEGFPVRFALGSGAPAGMSIDPVTGTLAWQPPEGTPDIITIAVTATDIHGLGITSTLPVAVVADTMAPAVDLRVVRGRFCPGEEVLVCVDAIDDFRVLSTELFVDSQFTHFEHGTCLTWDVGDGVTEFEAFAIDGAGNAASTTRAFDTADCVDDSVPRVEITAPQHGERSVASTEVLADLMPSAGADVVTWELVAYRADLGIDQGASLAEGTAAVADGLYGTFDASVVSNGLWMMRLSMADSSGVSTYDEVGIEVGGSFKPGRFVLGFDDFSMQLPVSSLSITRGYDTLDADVEGDFGYGWSLGVRDFQVASNGPLGFSGFGLETCGFGFGGFSEVCWTQRVPRFVAVTWPDGDVELFDLTPPPTSNFGAPMLVPEFTARPGTTSELRAAPGYDNAGFFNQTTGQILEFGAVTGVWDVQRFELTDTYGSVYLIDRLEGLLSVTDRFGNSMTFHDDGVELSDGPDIAFVRDAEGRIERIVDPAGGERVYDYDGAGDLVAVTDPSGDVMEFEYDDNHRLLAYNVQGRDAVSVQVFDADGRLRSRTDNGGVQIETIADPDALVVVEIGPDPALVTTMTYDERGRLQSVVKDFEDGLGVPQSYVTSFTYTNADLVESQTLSTGATRSWVYDDLEQVVEWTDAAGVVREREYGPFGQPSIEREGGEVVRRTEFGPLDLPRRVYRGDDTLVRYKEYDANGRVTTLTNGTGEVMTVTYDSRGFVDAMQLPEFAGTADIVDLHFGDRGELLEVSEVFPTGTATTTYEYDDNGRRTGIIDPRGVPRTFEYNALGHLTSFTDKLGQTVGFTHDENGRVLSRSNRNGETLLQTYDMAGRLETVSGIGVDRQFGYDALGRRVTAREGAHEIVQEFDVHGVVAMRAGGSGVHADSIWLSTHDDAGRLERLVGPIVGADLGMDTTHAFDTRGRLARVEEVSVGAFVFGYDTSGRRAVLSRPNGTVTTTTYDDADRPTARTTTDGSGVLHDIRTTYDVRGFPATQTDVHGTLQYTHDQRGRLTAVDHPPGSPIADESYGYDIAERRTSSHRDPAGEVLYDDGDRLLQDATFTYAYDAEGRRTSRVDRLTGVETIYTYSALDQLLSVQQGGERWTFVYDALGRRVRAELESGGVSQYAEAFVYDLNGMVRGTYDPGGARNRAYVTTPAFGDVLARVDTGTRYALRDRLGSTVAWLDGTTIDVTTRDVTGNRVVPATVVEPYGYTGHAEDPTELVWGRARHLDPRAGVWMSLDPQHDQPRCTYAGNSPSYLWDPTGESVAIQYASFVQNACSSTAVLGRVFVATERDRGPRPTGLLQDPDIDPLRAGPENATLQLGVRLEEQGKNLQFAADAVVRASLGLSNSCFSGAP